MRDYKSIETEYQKQMLVSLLTSVLANASDSVRSRCIEYSTDPHATIPKDVQQALNLLETVRTEYNTQLDALRDKYEVRLKMALAMVVNEIDRAS